jgi:hypothetical protein
MRPDGPPPDGLGPTPEQWRQGPMDQTVSYIGGELRRVMRTRDTLASWAIRRDISKEMLRAGRWFSRTFDLAHLDQLKAADLARPPGGVGGLSNKAEDARAIIREVHTALGGAGAPMADGVWHVIGNQITVADWARRTRLGSGQPLSSDVAKGFVIAGLSILANLYRKYE